MVEGYERIPQSDEELDWMTHKAVLAIATGCD
jgi:hypothetical protein